MKFGEADPIHVRFAVWIYPALQLAATVFMSFVTCSSMLLGVGILVMIVRMVVRELLK